MKIKKQPPFKVPKGYFDALEEMVLDKTKTNYNAYGFKTPKNYFETLEKKILRKTIGFEKKSKKLFQNAFAATLTAAACLALYFSINTTPNQTIISEKKSEQAFEDFIENYYLEDRDSYDILSLLEETEIETALTFNSKP